MPAVFQVCIYRAPAATQLPVLCLDQAGVFLPLTLRGSFLPPAENFQHTLNPVSLSDK